MFVKLRFKKMMLDDFISRNKLLLLLLIKCYKLVVFYCKLCFCLIIIAAAEFKLETNSAKNNFSSTSDVLDIKLASDSGYFLVYVVL